MRTPRLGFVLITKMYYGQPEEDMSVDEEDYIGYEIEFARDFFRLGTVIYDNPVYELSYLTVQEYNDGGIFRVPDIYDVLEEYSIQIDGASEYEWLADVPVKFINTVFQEDIPPVGAQCVILNDGNMLVGIWGKILLTRKCVVS